MNDSQIENTNEELNNLRAIRDEAINEKFVYTCQPQE